MTASSPTLEAAPRVALASELARAMTALRWEDVPRDVRETAKEHLADALGLAIASTPLDFGRAAHDAAVRIDGGPSSSGGSRTIGYGTTLTPMSAALVNGTLIHGLDFDDTHIGAIYHPTAPALAAALAVGDEVGASGEDVLLAYIIGLEVGCRLAGFGAGHFHQRGFHPTGIIGTFAAACVAARLRGLDAATLQSALGLCGSQAAGILELNDSWLKRMHPGWAAHAGIVAVTMAQAGFLGPATVFEGEGGVFKAHIGKVPTAEDLGLDDIGVRWWTREIALKPYPCCHFTQAFVDAAADILDQLGREQLTADDVKEITCIAPAMIIPMVCEPRERKIVPPGTYDALFSIPFVTSARLRGLTLDLALFYDQPLDDPGILALAAKVVSVADPDSPFPWHFPGNVVVTLADGREVRADVADSKGTKEHPLTRDEVLAKFVRTTGRVVPPAHTERVWNIALELEYRSASDLISATLVQA